MSGTRGQSTVTIYLAARIAGVSLMVFALASSAFGQGLVPTGQIVGQITDTEKNPLSGATVTFIPVNGDGLTRSQTTNEDGRYRQDGLPPGKYGIRIVRSRYKDELRDIVVASGPDQVVSASLQSKPPPRELRIWGGFSGYSLVEFNAVLAREANLLILAGGSVGAELTVVDLKLPFKALEGTTLKIPLGVEYLAADSTTTHSNQAGSATVGWNLPSIGLFVAPTLVVGKNTKFHLHPGLGYYFLGRWVKAGLSVTDRGGRLAVKGGAPGIFVGVGASHSPGSWGSVFGEVGYRYLRFVALDAVPEGAFVIEPSGPAVQGRSLAAPLDYSGAFFRIGFSIVF